LEEASSCAGAVELGIVEEGRSVVHPITWIIWAACAGLAAFVTTNPFYLFVIIAAAWFVDSAHRVTGPTARSFRVFLVAGIVAMALRTALVLLGTADRETVAFAALEGLRLAAILVVFGTFNSVTDPYGVVRLAPRRFHEAALAAALALSLAPQTLQSAASVREAQKLRGIHVSTLRALPALAVPVLSRGMDDALTLAESMDSRGHGRGTRTRYRPDRWSAASVICASAASICAAVYLLFSFSQIGDPHPVTDPLTLPAASPVLVGAALLLALPGLFPRRESRR
jgi:energy-coupling factor transport system permease protein